MPKKPYVTNKKFFEWIIEDVKKRDVWPCEIEYALAEQNKVNIKDYHFAPVFTLDYGACEGMYMELFLRGSVDNSGASKTVRLGSIKTLSQGETAVRMMAALYGECLIAYNNIMQVRLDDMERSYYSLTLYKSDGSKAGGYCCIRTINEAKEKFQEVLKYTKEPYHHAVIKDNDTEEEIVIDAITMEGSL